MTRAAKRRAAVTEATKRSSYWWTLALGGLSGLALIAAAAGVQQLVLQPGRLPLRVIDVNGDFQRLRPVEIQRTVMAAIDGGFFTCDMQRLRGAVLAMPWVEDVSVRRVWPDRLSIVVTEQVPLARWGDDALISVGGSLFRPPRLDAHQGLVALQGPLGSEQRVVGFYQSAVPMARARGLRVRAVELDERRHWWLRFDGDLTVSLGRQDVKQRLSQFFRVYPRLVSGPSRRPARVDMRYAHGFAVRWQEPDRGEPPLSISKPQGKV